MNDLPVPAEAPQIGSAIHLEFIRTVIESQTEGGIDAVGEFHRALFLHQHGKELERLQQDVRVHDERLAVLDAQLRRNVERLSSEERLVPAIEDGRPDNQPSAPWNFWDRCMFALASAGVLCLLVFGVLNVSFNLLESGIVTFTENPWRAYFWAALLPVGALAVKIGWDLLRSRRGKDLYLWSCLAAGVAGVLAWLGAYASLYPMLSQTGDEQLETLSVFETGGAQGDYLSQLTSGGVKRLDMILVAAQAIAEIALSAALGIYLTQLYAKHRPVRLAENSAFLQLDRERRRLDQEIALERGALAEARGEHTRLEQQLAVFVTYARSLFQRESALRRDRGHRKRLLIEEMADQLRARLDAVDHETAGELTGNGDRPALQSTSGAKP